MELGFCGTSWFSYLTLKPCYTPMVKCLIEVTHSLHTQTEAYYTSYTNEVALD